MLHSMETASISELLAPFLGENSLTEDQLKSISTYVDMLLRWNARMNLTAVRNPEQIVERHFGESFFVARHLLTPGSETSVVDVGSGAGFPGIPMNIYAPNAQVTLIEAHGKKATFLREIIRANKFTNIDVFPHRAESWGKTADIVTLRAVENFEEVLPVAARLVSPTGRLALLIGAAQAEKVTTLLPGRWSESVNIPKSRERVLKLLQNS